METKETQKRPRPTVKQVKELEAQIAELQKKNEVLDRSNAYMETELTNKSAKVEALEKPLSQYKRLVNAIYNRTLLERIANKKLDLSKV